MVKMSAAAGVTPWFALGYTGKLFERLFAGGGGVTVVRLGPKDARAEVAGLPLVSIPYFRAAMRGMWAAACDLFCRRTYVKEIESARGPMKASMRIAWV
jgi:hypothetical protein